MNVKKTFLWLVLLYLLFLCTPANATTLSAAAAVLAPGQFVNVTGMINLQATAAAYDTGPASPGPGYDGSQPSAWDPATGKLYIQMTEHGNASACPENFPNSPNWCWKKLWTYTDATNTWDAAGPYPNYTSGGGPVSGTHTWGYTAWDSANKTFYIRGHDTNIGGFWWSFFRYCATNSPASYCASQLGQWQQITGFNPPSGSQVGTSLGWMPTLNGGTLLAFDTDGNNAGCGALFGGTYVSGSLVWSTIDSGATCKFPFAATTLNRIVYSSQKNVAIFGPTGASALQWWKIDAAGNRSTLDTAPCAFHTTDDGFSQTAEDPSTGDILFIGCTQVGQMWRLNPTGAPGAQWTQMHATLDGGGATPQICNVRRTMSASNLRCGFDFVAMSIPTYGVIGFWKMRLGVSGGIGPAQQAAEFWLYKPSAVSSDVTPPTVSITAPTAGATVSGASVTLSANASDTVGVAGVQFKVDGVATGSEDTTAPYSISWNSTTVSNGSHTVTATARDAAGNTATSAGVAVTVSNAGSDFTTRCNAAGVFFCNGFDSVGDLGGSGFGSARGRGSPDGTPCNINNCPQIDTTVKVSGTGALKFTIPPGGSGADGGSYWANPSTDFSVRFGAGQTWYVQFRQRITASYASAAANNNKIHWASGRPDLPGCSTSSTANCFATCTENELVNQNQYTDPTKAFPRWYQGCPDPINMYELIAPITPGQYDLENGRTAPGCLYDNVVAGNIFPPNGNCFPYSFDQWVTWSYKITLGSIGTGAAGGLCFDAGNPSVPTNKGNCYYGGQVLARAGLDGQPLTTVLNWTGPMIAKYNTDPTELKYGKVWFAPYTGVGSVLPTGANMWFDELIMSLSPIADPGGDTTSPTVAITSPIPPTTSTTTSPITVSGTASDNISVTSVTWTCIQCVTKGGTATSSPGTSISWLIPALDLVSGTNTLNVVSHDAAGNVSTAATLTIAYAPSTTYWVRPTGTMSGCISSNTPPATDAGYKATITTGIGCLASGNTLYVRAGTYPERITLPAGTIVSGYLVELPLIKPTSGATQIVNMNASGVTLQNVEVSGQGLALDDNCIGGSTPVGNTIRNVIVHHCVRQPGGADTTGVGVLLGGSGHLITGLESYSNDNTDPSAAGDNGGYGLYLSGTSSTVEYSYFHDNGGAGAQVYPAGGNTVRFNRFVHNGYTTRKALGALILGGANNQAYSNVVYNNNRSGIEAVASCTTCLIYNNTIARNGAATGSFGINFISGTVTARNNILRENSGGNIVDNIGGGALTSSNNLCFGPGGTTNCQIFTDPLFVDYAGNDFRLLATSPANNAGFSLAAPYNTDINRVIRPQGAGFDLGAYESVATFLPVVTIVNPTANPTLSVTSPLFSLGGTSNLP